MQLYQNIYQFKRETMLKSIESDLLQLNIQHMTIQLETPEHKHDESTLCSGIHEHSH